MPATITFTATAPDGLTADRSSKTKRYTHALAVHYTAQDERTINGWASVDTRDQVPADADPDSIEQTSDERWRYYGPKVLPAQDARWGIASFHESADNAHKAGQYLVSGRDDVDTYEVVEVEITAVKGNPHPDDKFAILWKQKLADLNVKGDNESDAQDEAQDEAPAEETPRERRNRKARERRAAKRREREAAKRSEEQAQADAIAMSESLTVTEVTDDDQDDAAAKSESVTVTEVTECQDAPVEVNIEVNEESADQQIAEVLEVTPELIEQLKAQAVKGEKCPGYGLAVPADGATKGNGSHKRVVCPVCNHTAKRYDKSGKLGSHRV